MSALLRQARTLKTLTSLNKESRPFFLGDNSIWTFPSFLPLAITTFRGPEGNSNLAIIALGAIRVIVPKCFYRLGKMEKRSLDSLAKRPGRTTMGLKMITHIAAPPACYKGLSGPSGPKCLRECPENRGVSESVPWSVSEALRAPGPGSGVSKKCPESVWETFSTLRGHFWDAFWTLRSPRPEGPRRHTPWDTPGDTPVLGDTLGDTPGDTSGPKGPRDPCSRPAGSQYTHTFFIWIQEGFTAEPPRNDSGANFHVK